MDGCIGKKGQGIIDGYRVRRNVVVCVCVVYDSKGDPISCLSYSVRN